MRTKLEDTSWARITELEKTVAALKGSKTISSGGARCSCTMGKQAQVHPYPWREATSRGARCSCTLGRISRTAAPLRKFSEQSHHWENFLNNRIIEKIFRTTASLKDKRRTSRAYPNLLQRIVARVHLLALHRISRTYSNCFDSIPITSLISTGDIFNTKHGCHFGKPIAHTPIRLGELLSSYIFLIHQYNMLKFLYGFTIMPL